MNDAEATAAKLYAAEGASAIGSIMVDLQAAIRNEDEERILVLDRIVQELDRIHLLETARSSLSAGT